MAGAALARALAREGGSVLVLERETTFKGLSVGFGEGRLAGGRQ